MLLGLRQTGMDEVVLMWIHYYKMSVVGVEPMPFIRPFLLLLVLSCASVASSAGKAAAELDGTDILERATAAAGGEGWSQARSLVLAGHAVFWGPVGSEPRSRVDSYSMYREFDPNRTAAHGAEGKVRIIAAHQGRMVWTVGFDGTRTWTEKGLTPQAEADAFWASNMGFGILRHVRKPGFKAERVADGQAGRHPLFMVRLTDPAGGVTLFGIDQRSFAVRTMGFMTPKGWHERHYDDFVKLHRPEWLQARTVTLYYNGVKANTVYWRRYEVNVPIDPSIFAWQGNEEKGQ
jgi:hypothetical protein